MVREGEKLCHYVEKEFYNIIFLIIFMAHFYVSLELLDWQQAELMK